MDERRHARIVIADDEPDFLHLLGIMLEQDGHEIVGKARSAEEAVILTKESRPDLVILDALMPGGMSGIEAIPSLLEAAPGTQVLVLSASGGISVLTEIEKHGGHFIQKDRLHSDLRSMLDRLLVSLED